MSLSFLDLAPLLTFQQPGLLASGVKIELTLRKPPLKVENNTHAIFFLTNLSGSVQSPWACSACLYYRGALS
jgi:hypothetical protein